MKDFRSAVDLVSLLSTAAWAVVEPLLSVRRASKGEHLLRAGEQATQIFFVRDGLLREYYCDAAGHEFTRQFTANGGLSGSLADLISPNRAAVSIEALASSELLQADWAQLNAYAEQHPTLMKLLRRITEELYLRKTRREFEMLTLAAVERYRRFVVEYPGLDARLHRHQVASYLGITPVHLSRIRSMA